MYLDLCAKCPLCQTSSLRESSITRTFKPQERVFKVNLAITECGQCGFKGQSVAQSESNSIRMQSRLPLYVKTPCLEDYQNFRKIYGLTLRDCAKLFGVKTFQMIRYEQELDYPQDNLALLFKCAFQHPKLTKFLADKADVRLNYESTS